MILILFYILIAFILGVLFFFLVKYCIFKLSKTNSRTVFTNGISTEVIRRYYQELLISKNKFHWSDLILIPYFSCIFMGLFLIFLFIIYFIFTTIYHFWDNSSNSLSCLTPFCLFEINFRDSFEWKFNSYRDKPKISYMKLQTLTEDIIKLLDSLNDDKNYSMSLSFISSYNNWKENKEKVYPLFINDAIIVNKESDPVLITEFIIRSLNDKGLLKTNWLFKDHLINSMDPQILTVTVAIKIEI